MGASSFFSTRLNSCRGKTVSKQENSAHRTRDKEQKTANKQLKAANKRLKAANKRLKAENKKQLRKQETSL